MRMPGHTALILGAGFSRPAGGPLLRDLLSDQVLAISDADSSSLAALSELAASPGGPGESETTTLEDVFTDLWREARTGGKMRLGADTYSAEELLIELNIELASVCEIGRAHV